MSQKVSGHAFCSLCNVALQFLRPHPFEFTLVEFRTNIALGLVVIKTIKTTGNGPKIFLFVKMSQGFILRDYTVTGSP